jgi:hypothetical protein
MSLWRASGRAVKRRASDLELVAEIVGRARVSAPWPRRTTLTDGSIQYEGLNDAELNTHIARVIIAELSQLSLPDELVERAARAIFEAENDLLGTPPDDSHFASAKTTYRSAAITGFRAVMRQFARG